MITTTCEHCKKVAKVNDADICSECNEVYSQMERESFKIVSHLIGLYPRLIACVQCGLPSNADQSLVCTDCKVRSL